MNTGLQLLGLYEKKLTNSKAMVYKL